MTVSPRERRKARTRQAVMQAALEMVRENGPNGLSLRAVAKRVDYSPAALYEYFGSKDELMDALCLEGYQRFTAYLQSVPVDAADPATYLVNVGLKYIDFAIANPEHFRLIFDRIGENVRGTIGPSGSEEDDSAWNVLINAVRMNVAAGNFKAETDDDVMGIALGCWQMVHGMAIMQITIFAGNEDAMRMLNEQTLRKLQVGYRP